MAKYAPPRPQRVPREPARELRRDGLPVIRDFVASGRTYENAPQVLVWDYTVTRLLPDGTIMELTHQIYRAQSEEAVDDLGQFQAPPRTRSCSRSAR